MNNDNDTDKEKDNHMAIDNECGASLFARTLSTLGKIPSDIGSPISFEQLCICIEGSGLPIDPVKIWNHYALNHWTTKGRMISDWDMEVKRWYRIQQLENAFDKS